MDKEAIGEQRVDEKQGIVAEGLFTIEEGMEEEEVVEKERAADGKIGKKLGQDRLVPWWCKSGSFYMKGATWATKEKGGIEMPNDVAGEEIMFLFSATGKMITLMSSDGKQFKMSEAAARLSSVLADMIDDKGFAKENIPLPHVPSHALATVIKYCDKHADVATTKPNADHNAKQETLEKWDRELLGSLTCDDLLDLVKAANFLDIKGLEFITCEKIANMIKGKSPEQLREMFHVVNDFTKEEEEEIRKESSWAFPCNN